VVAAKELLYAYGKPAVQKLAAENDAAAKNRKRPPVGARGRCSTRPG